MHKRGNTKALKAKVNRMNVYCVTFSVGLYTHSQKSQLTLQVDSTGFYDR